MFTGPLTMFGNVVCVNVTVLGIEPRASGM